MKAPVTREKLAGRVTRDVTEEIRGGWRGVRSHRLLEVTVKTLAFTFTLSETEGLAAF